AANLHCIPPRGGEAEEEFEDVPKVAPPTPTYTVEDLIAQIRSKNVPITRWVSRKWSGEISFDQRHHNYHCRPVRFRDDHFDQWYRGESLDAIIAKLRSVSKFSEGFRLLEEGEQPAARPKGAPRIVDR